MMKPESLAQILQEFLADARSAALLEGAEEIFRFTEDSDTAKYSVSSEHGKCLLHVWSPERNAVRRVLDAELKKDSLLLSVQRFGNAKPSKLEVVRDRDRRSASSQRAGRTAYARLLQRVLERSFPDLTPGKITSAMDLERSFGPIYARGTLRRGRSMFAVLGVNEQESQASIDASLTFGSLWLDVCRERETRHAVEGLKLIVPRGTSAVLRERVACLDASAAKFEIHELEERELALRQMDHGDRGNIQTRLVRCLDASLTRDRFVESIDRFFSVIGAEQSTMDVAPISSAEISFRVQGLEVAKARLAQQAGSFSNATEIVFGAGANETVLSDDSAELCRNLIARVVGSRRAGGNRADAVWRMQPERWLEARVVQNVSAIDSALETEPVYSQVPAFSASDRAMIDVLACTREGRLAVLELKAEEDIHLPMQGLDYWARVQWHHGRGEFEKFGYFPGRQLSQQAPLLMLVAPALHVHPATDALLRYFAPEIDYTLIGVDERWRDEVKVVFRKRAPKAARA